MDPRQFDFTRRKWHWHNLPPEIAARLAEEASADELICVKATDTRAVYKFENLFIKVSGSLRIKAQLYPAARQEFEVSCKLQEQNINTVKHLGWGRSGHYTALITEAWTDDAIDALYYWYSLIYEMKDPTVFLDQLALFLQNTVNSRLKHEDFHLGNILYSPSCGEFTLVDLHNVSLGPEHTFSSRAEMLQILAELRGGLQPQDLLDMFWKSANIDSTTAARVIHRKLVRDMERTNHDWARRLKQFLHGYGKFSDFVMFDNQTLLVQRNKLRKNLFDPAAASRGAYRKIRLAFPAALEQMLFSFYLSLLQVPHVPVAALAPNGTLYYPQLPESFQIPEDREQVNSYNEYLLCMGLYLENYQQLRSCLHTKQLLVTDFSSMLAAMPNRSMFQPEKVDPRTWRVRRR